MSLAKRCDLCGEFYDVRDDRFDTPIDDHSPFTINARWIDASRDMYLDVCAECAAHFLMWCDDRRVGR